MKITWKSARINAGLKQEAVARALKVSVRTIQHWESYKTYPSTCRALAMASLYDVTLSDILLSKRSI